MNNMYRVLVKKSVSPPAQTIQRVDYNPSSFCAVTKRKQIPVLLYDPYSRYSVKN
jgi:hypothetical protein